MSTEIYPVHIGIGCCYVIKDKGVIMVDGGVKNKSDELLQGIANIPIKREEIQLLVITHGHWDHTGSVKEIQELTGARIAMHEKEKKWLEEGVTPVPPGVNLWGKILAGVMGIIPGLDRVPAASVDIVLDDNGFSLEEFGVAGRVIPTPGHSSGSVSVLLDSGEAFVGDLAMNMFPLRIGPGLPVFADDISLVKKSWKMLLDQGATVVYPAHGKPFSADVIKKAISYPDILTSPALLQATAKEKNKSCPFE